MENINFTNTNSNDIAKEHLENIQNQKEEGFSLFQQKPKEIIQTIDPKIQEDISTLTRRIKIIESTISNIRKSTQSLEKNQVENNKDNRRDIKSLEIENDELKDNIRNLKGTIKMLVEELQNSAKIEDVKTIQNYLNLWNPVHFVTTTQIKGIVKDILEDQK